MLASSFWVIWFHLKVLHMHFKVLSVSASNNLVLRSTEGLPVSRKMQLFLQGKHVGEVFETIGLVKSPLYLARAKSGPNELVGKQLEGK